MSIRNILRILAFAAPLCFASCRAASSLPTPAHTLLSQETPTIVLRPTPLVPTEELAGHPTCFVPKEILPFAFSPDGVRLFVRTSSGVQILNLDTGKEEAFIEAPQSLVVAALSPDGQTLAWSLEDNSIQLIRLSDQLVSHIFEGHPDAVYHLRFSPSGDRLFSASHDGWVRIWGTDGTRLPSIDTGREVVGFGVSQDGTMLATIPFDGPVQLWDLVGNNRIAELEGTGGYDTSDATFSPDGQYLAADLATGLFLWRVTDTALLWNDIKNSMAVTFSLDGRYLAYSNIDDNNNIVLASPDGIRIIRNIDRMEGAVWELFFSPDSSLLAATDGKEIRIWIVEDGTLLHVGKAACP